jgi:SAM-dependent methyltransferase
MPGTDSRYLDSRSDNYEKDYLNLPFENFLREYRKKNILEILKKYPSFRFLEVGCGPDPLFMQITEFDKMIVVEPGKYFFEMAKERANTNSNIIIINDLIEEAIDKLGEEIFDFIVIGGFLHEVNNPDIILQALKKVCTKNSIIYSWVPNANSFHRILALEMGLIKTVFDYSRHDKLFQRQKVYDLDLFKKLFTRNGFKVIESGTYFIKPFANDQMDKMLKQEIIYKNCLDGLDKMIKHMPDLGAELWICCVPDD